MRWYFSPTSFINQYQRVLCTLQTYSGSKRTFSALLKTMIKKERIGLVLALTRRNASPVFCAMVPQVLNLRISYELC